MGFITDDFLLSNKTAEELYEYVKDLPIIDYHCHINPQEIYEDKKFENITELWLLGDHYKWRLIRSNGIPEDEITGKTDNKLKFLRFAEALPKAIGNPIYHWTHLELKRYFGYDGILNADTANEVWELCNKKLKGEDISAQKIIEKSNVQMLGTTDDPIDSLIWHRKIAESQDIKVKVLPTFRPDKAVNIDKSGFCEYIKKLGEVADTDTSTFEGVKKALENRLDYFYKEGCKISDHGLDYIPFCTAHDSEIELIFSKVMNGQTISQTDTDKYKTAILMFLGRKYVERNITMQLHYGVQRNTNFNLFRSIGADTGFDCISVKNSGEALTHLLNSLSKADALPKTIIYSLNPNDNALIDTVIGCFQGCEAKLKIQHGSAWWFNDSKIGIEAHLKSLASLSLLGNFIGMLTDSRSLLSFTRHEYFRRILCDFLGKTVESNEYPRDMKALKEIAEGICYYNAKSYFDI